MRIIVIYKLSTFIESTRIRAFHYDMFHGFAEREGRPYPHEAIYEFGSKGDSSLCIARTGWRVPPITWPAGNMVINEAVRSRLQGTPYCEFLPVVFTKVFDIEFHPGDFSWYDKRPPLDSELIPSLYPDVPELRASMAVHYELLTLSVKYNQRGTAGYVTTSVEFGAGRDASVEELIVPVPVLRQGGIAAYGLAHMFPEEVFARIESYFDWDYFSRAELVVA